MTCTYTRRALAAAAAVVMLGATACSQAAQASGGNTLGIPDQVEGIPDVVLQAYGEAAAATGEIAPGCTGMRWSIVAGIGQEESHHGTYMGGSVGPNGVVDPPFIGPQLNGNGFAAIPDTDGGRYDGDTEWDRAVGPMQFIPSTWESVAPDATGKEHPDPQNIFDSARATVAYLCQPHGGAEEVDLNDEQTLRRSLMRYNQSGVYVDTVMGHIAEYDAIPVAQAQVAGASGVAAAAIAWAQQHEGAPYVWGGSCNDPQQSLQGARGAPTAQDRANNCDCSSLMQAAYASAGITLGRTTWAQFDQSDLTVIDPVNGAGSALTQEDLNLLQPGDMMYFFSEGAPGKAPTHVGMYLGGTQMIHAPNSRKNIETISMEGYYMGGGALYYGSRRVQG